MTASSHPRFVAALLVAAAVGFVAPGASQRAAASTGAAVLTRGPYLQRATPTSIIVRWRTDLPVVGWVDHGPAVGELTTRQSEPGPTTEHRIALSGLPAGEPLYYAIGHDTTQLAGDDADHVVQLPVQPGEERAVRLWIAGDTGAGAESPAGLVDALAVRDGFLTYNGGAAPDAWLLLGDNAYLHGTDAQYQAGLFAVYGPLLRRSPLWPALGNHDALSADSPTQSGPFFANFSLPRFAESGGTASGTEAYWSFDLGPLHIVCLDSADSDLNPGGAMLTWLETDLAATSQPWRLVFFHHPPYTKGSHDSDNDADSEGRMRAMREGATPIFERHGVALVLTGHSHGYERSGLIAAHTGLANTFDPLTMVRQPGDGDPAGDGAYLRGRGPGTGTVYVVAGSGSKLGGGTFDHPAMLRNELRLGSLVLDASADGRQLEVVFIDVAGVVHDRFVMIDATLFANGFEAGALSGWQLAP